MTIREWMCMVQAHVSHVERFDLEVLLGVRLDMGRASLLAHLDDEICLLYTSPSPRDLSTSRMPSSA